MIKRTRRQMLGRLATGIGMLSVGSAVTWAVLAPGNASQRKTSNGDLLETVPQGDLPSFAQQNSLRVQEAYRYADDNQDVLHYIPCFCGCKNVGHRHNADCYITERLPDGQITFNSHGAT